MNKEDKNKFNFIDYFGENNKEQAEFFYKESGLIIDYLHSIGFKLDENRFGFYKRKCYNGYRIQYLTYMAFSVSKNHFAFYLCIQNELNFEKLQDVFSGYFKTKKELEFIITHLKEEYEFNNK